MQSNCELYNWLLCHIAMWRAWSSYGIAQLQLAEKFDGTDVVKVGETSVKHYFDWWMIHATITINHSIKSSFIDYTFDKNADGFTRARI